MENFWSKRPYVIVQNELEAALNQEGLLEVIQLPIRPINLRVTRVPASTTVNGETTPICTSGNNDFVSGTLEIAAPIEITISGSAKVILFDDARGAVVHASGNSRVLVYTEATVIASESAQVAATQWASITGIGSDIKIFVGGHFDGELKVDDPARVLRVGEEAILRGFDQLNELFMEPVFSEIFMEDAPVTDQANVEQEGDNAESEGGDGVADSESEESRESEVGSEAGE